MSISPSPRETSALSLLFRLVESALQLHDDDEAPVDLILSQLNHYSIHFSDWKKYALFSPTHYTRNLVEMSDFVEFIVLCWNPQQESRVHDHDGSDCLMVVLQGEVVEKRFTITDETEVVGEKRKSSIVSPALQPSLITTLTVGGGAVHISDKKAYHSVGNYSTSPAVTLHIYSPPIRRVKLFDIETKEVSERTPGFYSVNGRTTGKL